jgi:hypothetical protein
MESQVSITINEAQERVKYWEAELEYAGQLKLKAIDNLSAAKQNLKELYRQQDECLSRVELYRLGPIGYRDQDCGSLVILRQTPSGMLVCRKYGEPHSDEMRFKFNRWSQEFTGKQSGGTYELSEVPQEYIDRALAAADKAQQS